ncbi:16S rRNA (guanine(527)-N(7))-methyltransferase RsmG [Nocardioides zeae]|uniref:Ribosomal RNA small subunit methyltransferase G n=1 Tax=Nocardioides imazamoxiresistens TaxID=3231893 RepID=A0ABU3PUQ9_9ACTN|nr:16S rRNA (guanine(527)-N(7))-methyltransferase RsmG [Nocardioides zeae]MDT9592968.1 16S rRNA (guanine(527)-N(7))-methyltransferase RsmG [Nocardioides zeae]
MPESARGVFGIERLPLAERYAASLATDGVVRGLIGPREVPRLWDRHLLNCAVMTEAVPRDVTLADIGSGAGLPGLVLAIARPDVQVTLIEPLLRRTTYLDEVVETFGLENVTVVRGRADEVHGRQQFDVVTSRAVAALDKLARWSMPLVRRRGELLVMKGGRAQEEIDGARTMLKKWSDRPAEVVQVGAGVVDPPTTLVRVVRTR